MAKPRHAVFARWVEPSHQRGTAVAEDRQSAAGPAGEARTPATLAACTVQRGACDLTPVPTGCVAARVGVLDGGHRFCEAQDELEVLSNKPGPSHSLFAGRTPLPSRSSGVAVLYEDCARSWLPVRLHVSFSTNLLEV